MPVPYNLTGLNQTGLGEKVVVLNDAVNGMLGMSILLIIVVTIFFMMKDYPMKIAGSTSLYIGSIVAIILFAMNMLDFKVLAGIILLTAIATIALYLKQD